MTKKEYITQLAGFLRANGKKMAGNELADHLNRNNIKTDYGAPYEGGRGIYKLLHATYDTLVAAGKQTEADNVAFAFTKPNGEYAFH